MPFYPTFPGVVYDSNRKMIGSADTPALAEPTLFAGKLSSMDITFQARMYLVWKFPDSTIYTLAYADWQVVFKASTWPLFGLQLSPNSVVSASLKVLNHADPAKITAPAFNSAATWVLV